APPSRRNGVSGRTARSNRPSLAWRVGSPGRTARECIAALAGASARSRMLAPAMTTNPMTTQRNGGPVALVLSGGGARAAYQVGLLRYLRRAFPDFRFQIITGTSAGGINAAYLASHAGTMSDAAEGLAGLWENLTFDLVFRVDARALAKSVVRWGTRLLSGGAHIVPRAKGLLDTAPLRQLLSTVMATVSGELVGIGENVENGRLSALALTSLNWATGQTVTWLEARDVTLSSNPQ